MLKLSFVCLLTIVFSFPTYSCGIATHAWVSKVAITHLDGDLRSFAEKHLDVIYNGSYFPDSGYADWVCEASYGEIAHWPPFMNDYLDYIKETCRLPDGTTSITGECGTLIAFFLGAVSHGITDNWHDSHFLVTLVEMGFFPDEDAAQTVTDRGFDATAVNNIEFGIYNDVPEPTAIPRMEQLTAILNRTLSAHGRPKINPEVVRCGTELMSFARMAQPVWAYYKEPGYLLLMPKWALEHRLDAKGGVYDNASHVASFWKEFWIQITETPTNKYKPKRLRSSGGWPFVKIWWEPVNLKKTKTQTHSRPSESTRTFLKTLTD
jgi:hypothetical protein